MRTHKSILTLASISLLVILLIVVSSLWQAVLVYAERPGAVKPAGVSVRHEINNPLTTVIGNLELLIERYEHKDKELTARLEVVLNSSLRIAEITKQLQEIKMEKPVESEIT